MITYIKESKEDIQSFIDKFGEESLNKVRALSNSPTAKKMNLNDLTFCVSRYSKEWMETLLADCEKEVYSPKFNKRFGGALAHRFNKLLEKVNAGTLSGVPKEKLDYKYWLKSPKRELISFIREYGYDDNEKAEILDGSEKSAEENGWIAYHITNYLASEYYGMGSGWCISGAYPGSYDRGSRYFYDYSDEGYHFIINEEADERYCVFDDDGTLEIWDGSHGVDKQINDVEEIDSEEVQDIISDIKDELGVVLRSEMEVPEDDEDQVRMIEEDLESSDWIDWISENIFCGTVDYIKGLDNLRYDQEEYFRRELTQEEQFDELKNYLPDLVEEYESFDDVPPEVAERLWENSDEYADAWVDSFGGSSNYISEFYGNWDSLAYVDRMNIASMFDVSEGNVADYIVYGRREGYEWCESIIESRE